MKRFSFLFKGSFRGLRDFLLLWATQALSALGSAMTSFALVIWAYQQEGSALASSLLSVCSYAPYVLLGIFAGALSDRWDKKRTMLVCDTCAALCTLTVLLLLQSGRLCIWHLYLLNALNGLMGAFQNPASAVAVTLLTPKEQYQRVGGLQSLSSSLVSILTPVFAAAVLSFGGLGAVIAFDLFSFGAAFLTLLFFISIPAAPAEDGAAKPLQSAREGLAFLWRHRGLLDLILFMAVINLVSSMYEAALAPMVLSRTGGNELALGTVNTCVGIASVAGSLFVSLLPSPKSRVRAVFNATTFAMSAENFFLAFGRSVPLWCVGGVLGWIAVPVLNTNLGVILREKIPVNMQGRVYAARNTLQFFTIPAGYFLGGLLLDRVFEPLMSGREGLLPVLFGTGKGSGAGVFFFILGVAGIAVCLIFRRDRRIWQLDTECSQSS